MTLGVEQFAFPLAAMPVANAPLHCVGVAARAVPACPLILELVRATDVSCRRCLLPATGCRIQPNPPNVEDAPWATSSAHDLL